MVRLSAAGRRLRQLGEIFQFPGEVRDFAFRCRRGLSLLIQLRLRLRQISAQAGTGGPSAGVCRAGPLRAQ